MSDVVVVGYRSPAGNCQREVVAFETLVAKLAAEQEVRPFVGQPVVTRADERLSRVLSIGRLGSEMLNVTVGNVGDFGLTKSAFVVLSSLKSVLDGGRAVEAGTKIEPL
jgi:hypothetical protein